MSEIKTIKDIRDIKNEIKDHIKTVNTLDYAEQKFGNEEEYTYKDLLVGVDSLVTDITSLIKSPAQFLKLSTFEERRYIFNTLNDVKNRISDPSSLYFKLDELKKAIRPFHIILVPTLCVGMHTNPI